MWAACDDRKADRFTAREIWQLTLAQQNGITAIILSLNNLELAIVVVNLLHFVVNGVFDRVYKR